MTNAITTAIARECRLSSACYLSFRVMARAAEFSPWLVRWRESHGRLIRVVQAGRCAVAAFIFKPDFVIFSPSALRTLTNAHQFARRETWLAPVHLWKCDEKLRFSLSLPSPALDLWNAITSRDRRTFSETRRVCRQCGVAPFWMNSRISRRG